MISGNMFTGLHQQTLFLRLSAVDRAEFMVAFAARLPEPRPGETMTETVLAKSGLELGIEALMRGMRP